MISAGSGFAPAAGGMAQYYEGLLTALCARSDVAKIIAFVPPWSRQFAVPEHAKIVLAPCRGLTRRRAGRVAYEQFVLPVRARRHRVDVLFSTCNIRPFLWGGASVVVLQSLQHALLPVDTAAVRGEYLRRAMPPSLRTADIVIAVTETSRVDAIELFGIDPDRIVSVYHGASDWTLRVMDEATSVAPYRLANGRPFLFMISRLYELKNHARLIAAFAEFVRVNDPPHALVIAGGDADLTARDLLRLAADAGVGDRVHVLGPVDQEIVPALYQGADAVAYVSLYETFGLPVLEALACGRPLLTSSRGATAEVGGEATCLADPYDVTDIANGLRTVLLDSVARARLALAGPTRVRDFTWEACAEGSVEAIRRAIGRHADG